MAIPAKQQKWLKENCSNFLYAFIPEASLKYFTVHSNIIATKRKNQQWTINILANKHNVSYREVETQISNYIKEIYGMSPEDALIALANGETVAGKNWRKGIYGIGAIPTVNDIEMGKDDTFTNGYKVDTFTGHILNSSGKQVSNSTGEIYAVEKIPFGSNDYDYQNVRTKIGVTYIGKGFSLSSKAVFLKSSYDAVKSGQSKANLQVMYVVDKQNYGEATTNAAGAIVTAEDGEIWANSGVWETILNKLLNWILSLFGVTTPKAEDTVINQSVDGFTPEVSNKNSGTSIASLGLLAGGLLLAVNMGDDKKGKKKGKKSSK